MKIAILGSTSEIAKDMISRFSENLNYDLYLFSRSNNNDKSYTKKTIDNKNNFFFKLDDFSLNFSFDVIINFIGSGNPSKTAEIGASIISITEKYDKLILDYLIEHKTCKYIFISSGAVYGSVFSKPLNQNTAAKFSINNLTVSDWYGIAKFCAESRHRAMISYNIVDIRIFNYFSYTQDISSDFLMMQIVRSIKNDDTFKTSNKNIYRDFIDSDDLFNLICKVINYQHFANCALDCFSKSPVSKLELLDCLESKFNFKYKFTVKPENEKTNDDKVYYYSSFFKAKDFGYSPNLKSIQSIVNNLNLIFNKK